MSKTSIIIKARQKERLEFNKMTPSERLEKIKDVYLGDRLNDWDKFFIEWIVDHVENLEAENKILREQVGCNYSHEFKIGGEPMFCNKCGWLGAWKEKHKVD